MAPGSGNSWVSSVAYPQLGDYVFAIEAVDPSGNWNRSAQGSFRVDDTTPPTIGSVTAVPSPAEVYLPAKISALVSDPFLLPPVAIVLDGTNYTMTLNTTTGRYERTFTPDQVRAYTFTIWAIDGSGNPASHVGAVDVQDTIPPQMPTGLVATVRTHRGSKGRDSDDR